MWRRNMAARRRGEESDLTTGNSGFLPHNHLSELVLSRSHSEDVDHSILAILEDSAGSPESCNGAEEANESLLCALNEMLERVGRCEDGDDGVFSPFDILPNTELLHQADEPLLQEHSPSLRLRPRPTPPNEALRFHSDGEQKVKRNRHPLNQNQKLFCSKTRRAKSEVEVFTSTSLVSLVKLMHPYCLQLHVEKEDDSLFSQEEVWRYERPSEESDEEINVVSDDEAPLKETEEEEGKRGSAPCLKSALLNGKPHREKKRVSFGPVHVASFNESEEENIQEKNSDRNERMETREGPSERKNGAVEETLAQTKTKSLSLQEYRQLRLNRRPLVEEHRSYATRWPSVSELPTELTPILPVQRPNPAAGHSASIQRARDLKRAKPHSRVHHSMSKRSKPESRISPTSPLPDDTAERCFRTGQQLLSSDPPNPVLVPLPAPHTAPESGSLQSFQNRLSAAPRSKSTEATPPDRDCKVADTPPHQALPKDPAESPQELSRGRAEPAEPASSPDPGRSVQRPSSPLELKEVHAALREELTDVKEPEPPQTGGGESAAAAAVQSGIEAADLTSLLEQFEETQAIEDSLFNDEADTAPAASSSLVESGGCVDLDRAEVAGSEHASVSPLKPIEEDLAPLSAAGRLNELQTLDVPEPLCTEIVLSSQKNRRSVSLKSVQIIDPQPLRSRKLRTGQSEPSAARSYLSFCSDHDYCGSADRHPQPEARQLSEPSPELELMAQDSGDAGGGKASWNRSDPNRTGSETNTGTDEALRVSPSTATEAGSGVVPNPVLCSLPTPPPTPPARGRSNRRYRRRSPRSDSSSSSSSCSCSPKRPRVRCCRSESSSCSSSPSSCASPPRHYRTSWSRSRSRSRSPEIYHRSWRDVSISRESRRRSRERDVRIQKLKAIDERRVVYVGRIRRTMTHGELRERFSRFGEVECVSLHFRDGSDHYGFVTFYNTEDAFAAIDNGGKLRKPDELPFDLCFGGRRQFCNSDYADLDANREAEPPSPPRSSSVGELDFDSLLKQAQRGRKR